MTDPFAIVANAPGGPEVLTSRPIVPPEPGPGEVRIRQTAIGVNYIDVYYRSGAYPWPVERDLILGSEGAGVVEAVGEGVRGFAPGDRVAYTVPNGGYATHRLVPAAMLVRIPDGIADEQAAAAMLKGLTVHYLIHDSYGVREGDTVLVHAAAGGVGLIMGQWLRARGVRAIGTAGGAEKCALARANGYAEVIDYRAEDFVARTRELTGGQGVAAVYDSVGADTIMGSLDCLARFGTLVSFGQSSGKPDQLRVSDLGRGSLRLTRPTLFHYATRRDWLERASAALFDMIGSGAVRLTIGHRAPLAEAAAVHRALEGRATAGSIVMMP
jgi:NADPH2:quinone reductase